ncbi:hypothetical protein [Bradyrhizobium sp. NBAIM01]|uniref:hypothetical protein n=1 Tax=Bradyrhizobium sp. NBAIM01 TaxID=2793818 RepID=UPI001CD42B96|nr:hypothetical protein [Bradyrhizobium sp. NBAIM01]MCA1513651.1 hypothetical protein [Bradyrhizobium sp. NBAIM01]
MLGEAQSALPETKYIASLVDIEDPDLTYSSETINATSDVEAKAKARAWAMAESQKTGKVRLIVTGGSIHGGHSELIEP